jgi:hypothetical protein
LAFALAQHGAQSTGVSMTPGEETGIHFPIVPSDTKFKEQVSRNRLKFVDSKAVALIEARQPYRMLPSDPDRAPLMRVATFDNTDKHRTINVAVYAVIIHKVSWPARLNDCHWQPPADYRGGELGTEIGRFVFPSPESEMDVPVELGFACVLAGVLPVYGIWTQVEQWVRDVRLTVTEIADLYLP